MPINCAIIVVSLALPGGGGGFCGNSWWGLPPSSPNPDLISDRKIVIFHTRFQTGPLKSINRFQAWRRQKLYHHYLQWIKMQRKRFLKIHFEAHFTLSFLIIWNLSNKSVLAVSYSLENHTQNQT